MYMNPINTMRVSGLASGIDTDSLVSQLMAVERIPLDRLKQNRQLIEWTQEAYRDINSTLLAFRNQVFNMRLQGTFLVNKVTSSNEAVATATAGPSATGSVYDINVTQLASSARAISSGTISIQKSVATGGSLTFPLDLTGRSFTLTVGNSTYVVDNLGNYNNINELVNDINNKIDESAGVTVYAASDNKLQFVSDSAFTLTSSDDTLAKLGFNVAAGGSVSSSVQGVDVNESINLMIRQGRIAGVSTEYTNSVTFSITSYVQDGTYITKNFTIDPATQSLQDVISKIQSEGLSLTGFYDSASDKVAFSAKYTGDLNPGSNNDIRIADTTGFWANVFKITQADVTDGTDAQFTVNGLATSRKNNTFAINGVTFTLKGSGSATISVQQDVDAVVAKIKDFITQYNDTLDKIYTKLNEKRYRDYPPLTDEQKDAMKDNDIEKWEEKAKSGLLNGDVILYNTFYDLRNAVSDAVKMDTTFVQAYDIGITSGQWYENGHLYLDETKLRDALAKDPNAVMQFFTKTVSITIYDTDSEATKQQKRQEIYDKSGIAQRLYNILGDVISSITDKAGQAGGLSLVDNSVLGKQLKEMDRRIDDMEQRLIDIENRYYRQFTAMEQALNQMNAQSSWLAQQLGAFQK